MINDKVLIKINDAAERERRRSDEILARLNKKAGRKSIRLLISLPLHKIAKWLRRLM